MALIYHKNNKHMITWVCLKSLSKKYTGVFAIKIKIDRIYFIKFIEKIVSGKEIVEMNYQILRTVNAGNMWIHFTMLSIR